MLSKSYFLVVTRSTKKVIRLRIIFCICIIGVGSVFAVLGRSFFFEKMSEESTVWVRVNFAGYTPDRVKIAVVLSDTDISEHYWELRLGKEVVLSGKLGTAIPGDDYYVAQPFNYIIDFSSIQTIGDYKLKLTGAKPEQIRILADPYSVFASQALMHLRAMRSRHIGDSIAIVQIVKGDWRDGNWEEATPHRTLDMRGGHYDAGDYIKFTLNEAYLAWHLLTAYQENPFIFSKIHIESELPDILDVAKYSLDYLTKTFPDENTFVVQVGDTSDHKQGWRLPEMDALEGKRPALCALSRVHMGSTAAALALGAQVFKNFDSKAASFYEEKAKAIYARALKSDTQLSAFQRDQVNEYYYDRTDNDNMALAAAELFRLTGLQCYLDQGKRFSPDAASEVSWTSWNSFANLLLAQLGDEESKKRMKQEALSYERDNLWNIPGGYTWGSLYRWIGAANAHLRTQRYLQDIEELPLPFLGALDYVFGRNNWGIAMIATPDITNSIRNICNGIYRLTNVFPTGALSEGPADRNIHNQLRKYIIPLPEDNPFEKFNTAAGVFYDNADDFMIQESAINGQGDFLLMLALASSQKY